MELTALALAKRLNGDLVGDGTLRVSGAQTIGKATPHDVTFAADAKNLKRLRNTQAGAAIVPRSALACRPDGSDGSADQPAPNRGTLGAPSHGAAAALRAAGFGETGLRCVVAVDDPLWAFLSVLEQFRPRRPRPKIGVSPQATVSPTARIGAGTNVHPGAVIGDDAVIGDECDIHPGVCVGAGCRLGNRVTLYPNVVLYPGVTLGHRVRIHAGAVVGADGFGYRLVDGRHHKLPHYGTVRIEDDVEIGACATIDRAMVGETVIGEGTKIDNLVMVAHNCEVGRHNLFVSQVGLAGSVTTGNYVVCAGQVGIADHVHLGDGCVLGAMAGVHKDMPGGRTYLGAPALPEREAIRIELAQRRLPELRKELRQLEARLAELESRLPAETGSPAAASAAAASAATVPAAAISGAA